VRRPAGNRSDDRRLSLGYREATAVTATPWLDAGARVRGHEFHYTELDAGECEPAWVLAARGGERPEGIVAGGVQASYLHVNWAAHAELAWRFAHAARVEAAAGAR